MESTHQRKTCSLCTTPFEISPDESEFRTRIAETFEAGPVPEPTLCPDCRMQRRMAVRNEHFLYNRKCSKTGKQIISVYPENVPFPVYEKPVWWSDDWDALDYAQDYDFEKPFFDQFAELLNKVPRSALNIQNSENCDYCNFVFDSRNCYLSPCTYRSESLFYCYWSLDSKDCMDCSYIFKSEKCVNCTDCNHSYNCTNCVLSHNCIDSEFLYDCRSCTNCFGCIGLRHKEYHMFNEKLSKEEYEKRRASYDLHNPEHLQEIGTRTAELKSKHPHLYSIQEKTENCTGDYIFESKNCNSCYQLYRSEDCLYVQDSEVKNCLDSYHIGWSGAIYECYSVVNQQASAFCSQCWDGGDNFYSDNCHASSHLYGCIGLRHKKYCILNKQYSKEEYEKLLPQIVEHMKGTKEWGEFFPISISPFPFNETMAQVYYPLTKEKVLARGYDWRDPDTKEYREQTYQVPSSIKDAPDSIVNEILACKECSKNYKIIAPELKIYREKGLPIPIHCPSCRNSQRLAVRNPRKLWDRTCAKCSTDIKTTYPAESPETVYCEKCYLKEIY